MTPKIHSFLIRYDNFNKLLVPDHLRKAISHQLIPRWGNGCLYDKLMVVRHGCLLPVSEYQEILEWAIGSNMDQFLQASFLNAQFLTTLPDSLGKWIRQRFANETLVSGNKIELLKLDALGSRLPKNLCAPLIFQRCNTLRSILYQPWPARFLIWGLVENSRLVEKIRAGIKGKPIVGDTSFVLLFVSFWYAMMFYLSLALLFFYLNGATLSFSIMVCLITVLALLFIQLQLRSEPSALTPIYIIRKLSRSATDISYVSLKKPLIFLVVAIATVTIFKALFITYELLMWFILASYLIVFLATGRMFFRNRAERKKQMNRLHNILQNEASVWGQIRQATSANELLFWLENKPEAWLIDATMIRSILRHAEAHFYESDDLKDTAAHLSPPEEEVKQLAKYLIPKLESNY